MVRDGHTDLFCEEGHDGEDDERHKDTVRPELQLVPIHSPGVKKNTLQLVLNKQLILHYPVQHHHSLQGRLADVTRREHAVGRGQQGNGVTR